MKRYYNENLHLWYKEGDVLKYKIDDKTTFLGIPTKYQLKEFGFEDYSFEGRLQSAKDKKIAEVDKYDKSTAVNEFTYQGVPMWLDKITRVGLFLRFNSEQNAGKTMTSLWNNGQSFELSLTDAFQLLEVLEVYASACYDRTEAHKAAIQALNSLDAINEYDYTIGYPQKLNL